MVEVELRGVAEGIGGGDHAGVVEAEGDGFRTAVAAHAGQAGPGRCR